MRPLIIKFDPWGYADAAVLLEQGRTKVLVSITLQNKVPRFLRGKGEGWLTAEYAMLPSATTRRTIRDSSQFQKNARGVEISRLIGRSLRTVVDLSLLGERSIIVDCDVLQADGGTRVACITAAGLALELAVSRWLNSGTLFKNIIKDSVAAISVGLVGDNVLLDLDFSEDSSADADFNFILTRSGGIIEIQGTSEKTAIGWSDFDKIRKLAVKGVDDIFSIVDKNISEMHEFKTKKVSIKRQVVPSGFSLASRLVK